MISFFVYVFAADFYYNNVFYCVSVGSFFAFTVLFSFEGAFCLTTSSFVIFYAFSSPSLGKGFSFVGVFCGSTPSSSS